MIRKVNLWNINKEDFFFTLFCFCLSVFLAQGIRRESLGLKTRRQDFRNWRKYQTLPAEDKVGGRTRPFASSSPKQTNFYLSDRARASADGTWQLSAAAFEKLLEAKLRKKKRIKISLPSRRRRSMELWRRNGGTPSGGAPRPFGLRSWRRLRRTHARLTPKHMSVIMALSEEDVGVCEMKERVNISPLKLGAECRYD